jgi:hypothetical protein
MVFDYNLYFDAGGAPLQFLGFPLDEWRKKGLDVHSLVADPLFVNPGQEDYRLKPESPALKLGFQAIDMTGVGPRKQQK